jgi:hypothetical protein
MSKLKVVRFINTHPNWRAILSAHPYNLMFRDFDGYTLIKYNQLFSDFKEPMVREARGFIIKKEGYKYVPVCIPFTKFFCVGDPNAQDALYKLAHRDEWYVEEKIDGSLIKLWWDNDEWHISTSGTTDAEKAAVQFEMNDISNYKQLFMYASKDKIDYDRLNKRFTYMFELVGLENKVIVPYEKEDVYYLGRRDNYTLLEIPYFDDDCAGVEKCKRPKCRIVKVNKNPKKVMKELQKEVNSFTKEHEHFEGYVISDRSLKTRVKMKSTQYMELFFQKGNGIFSPRKILLMILDQKDDDVLSSFPEYRPKFDMVRRALCIWLENVKNDLRYMDTHTWENKKSFAEWAKTTTNASIIFAAYGQDYWAEGWLEDKVRSIQIDNLVKYIGIEERKDDIDV